MLRIYLREAGRTLHGTDVAVVVPADRERVCTAGDGYDASPRQTSTGHDPVEWTLASATVCKQSKG